MPASVARLTTVLAALLLTVTTAAGSQTVAITGATVIDGTGRAPMTDAVVLIRDGRIVSLGSSREVKVPEAATRTATFGCCFFMMAAAASCTAVACSRVSQNRMEAPREGLSGKRM